jgi:hypothetical protein
MAHDARDTWRQRVRLWKTSGLTAEQFSEGRGFKAGTLRHWSWLLGAERRGWKPRPRGAPPVVEISLSGAVAPAAAPPAAPEPFELVVGDQLRVRVPARFDPAALTLLLSVLEVR